MKHRQPFRAAVGAAVASVVLALAAPTGAGATLPGANGRIAFTANLHGAWQIYTMNPNGAAVRQVTHIRKSQDDWLGQAWSPDGRRLAFHSHQTGNFDIYTINADGTGIRQLTHDPDDEQAPAWAPDGRRITFARSNPQGKGGLWRMNADGTNQRRLTGPAFLTGFGPIYTPDGKHILFSSQQGGLVAAVWIMNTDGSHQRRLTPATFEGTPWDVSPDGRHVLVGDHQNTPRTTSLYVMNLDGTGLHRLTNAGCCYHDANARYSPDGTTIAFTTDRTFADRGVHQAEIWEMTATGGQPHQITTSLTLGGCPDELIVNCIGPADWNRR